MTDEKAPILLDIPDQIETERLILRVPRPGDGPAIYDGVVETLDALRRWMPWAQPEPTVERYETYARTAAVAFVRRESVPLLMFRKSDGLYLGGSGVTDRLDWDVPRFEIGYWVRTSAEGQGYVTEATRAVTDFCFTNLKAERVEIRMEADNLRSAAVAERCGYVRELVLRRWTRNTQGDLSDMIVYRMIRSEWQALA